jgi:uncharacterized protein (TIGR00369 family)
MDNRWEERWKVGFDAHYGLELSEITPERVVGRVPVRPEILQPTGLVHGGVYAAIAESMASLGTGVGVFPELVPQGLSNQTSFLRPILEGSVNATAVRRHQGRTTWVWDVELSDDEGRLCAVSRMTIAVRPPR